MVAGNVTPKKRKTIFGDRKNADFYSSELEDEEKGEIFNLLLEESKEDAQAFARALNTEDDEMLGEMWESVRSVGKKKITNRNQPDWGWTLFGAETEHSTTKLLDIPSEGESKGLILDRDRDKAYLYPKKANGKSDIEHVERWHLNIQNAQAIGYDFASETAERAALELDGQVVPVLEVDYNSEMVLTSDAKEALTQKHGEKRGKEIYSGLREDLQEKWVKDADYDRKLPEDSREDWLTGIEFLIENGYFKSEGVEEYRWTDTDNQAIELEEDGYELLMVDAGEYPQRELGEENENSDYEFKRWNRSGHDIC
ncbi:hypothetical protein [Candidatus Nanohalococcus occultus]|uniref:Uncharacterized protein n=1 Tax=Candidatus Nanohalococcus occultus TaxID=2978047 RepID=A0ABY8CEG7_9ARCH|nr:hypothetical protein SVXNc_0569 [Candidatus Nanohaloarchaeota archaeon SVXNc]